jgi:hypothetical protein
MKRGCLHANALKARIILQLCQRDDVNVDGQVQCRFETALSGEEYVRCQAWRTAFLPRCPLHPQCGCGFARHGTYRRVNPRGARIARWYCPQGHCTFSLLPDFLASHLSDSLDDLEQTVVRIEQSDSVEAAADALRSDDIMLPGAIRWARRRMTLVHDALRSVVHALPERFAICDPSVTAFRSYLSSTHILARLREVAALRLQSVRSPLGFAPHPSRSISRRRVIQHDMGPDPPAIWQ